MDSFSGFAISVAQKIVNKSISNVKKLLMKTNWFSTKFDDHV